MCRELYSGGGKGICVHHRELVMVEISVTHLYNIKRGAVVKYAHGLWGPFRIYVGVNKNIARTVWEGKLCCLQRRTNGNNVQISELEINNTGVELALPYFTNDKNKTEGGRASIT